MRHFCTSRFTVACATWLCLWGQILAADSPSEDVPSFSRQIQPLLSEHCFICHGANEAESGLRLDDAESAMKALESGVRAIVPGKPELSDLMHRVTSNDESTRMPPDGDPLSTQEIDLLRRWIAGGAGYEQHWAWQPVAVQDPSSVRDKDWVLNSIDRFVLARLEKEQIEPSPAADRATLIQRLYYDLLGLPPDPNEVDAFLNDESPNAYEVLIDRLLDSHHFGERWGRHWLDKARYADSDGYEKDNPRPNAWRYRDWVIDAINRDLPFDQFTIEQLAGDLLLDATPMQKLATAFHRQTLTNTEGGTDQEEFRVEANFDRTETTSAVWMALTMTCARCHDHKYDQISQREYYQVFAFFNDANDGEMEIPISESKIQKYERDKQAYDDKVADAKTKLDDATIRLQPEIDAWTAEVEGALSANASPLEFQAAVIASSAAQGGAEIVAQPDGSLLVSGPSPERDKITLVLQFPGTAADGTADRSGSP